LLKYFPTLRRLDLDSIDDLEQLFHHDHQCLEVLSIEANWGERGSEYEGEKLGELPAHHPARRFADAFCAARAKNPSLLPALQALIIPNDQELYPDSVLWDAEDDDEPEDSWEWGLSDIMQMLRKEGVGIADRHGYFLS
jgi:hypothetical protein